MFRYKLFAFNLLLFSATFAQKDPHFLPNRNTIVQLFEWKWNDIAQECEEFLQYKGYGGVQVSPPNENIIYANRPWWERHNSISYKLETRSGNEAEFAAMVSRCNKVGIRIFVTAILNHMGSCGLNSNGTGGSTCSGLNYPCVPYQEDDFNVPCPIHDYNETKPEDLRDCSRIGNDLNQKRDIVRGILANYLNHLIELGVAGFEINVAKYMWPADLEDIYNMLINLNLEHGFPKDSRPYIYQDVVDLGGEVISANEYIHLGVITEFKLSAKLGYIFRGHEKLAYLENWGPAWGLQPNSADALVFIDNEDNQRGHGAGGADILTHQQPKQYKMATAFMLAHPYGTTRLMSSFEFNNTDHGPPQDEDGNIISPTLENGVCSNGWVCEHRWRQIYNMVEFRNAVERTEIENWWSNGEQQIAFCRGNKGFVAFTNEGDINYELQTCLPAGHYCDIISGNLLDGKCTGKTVAVNSLGIAKIILNYKDEDSVLAIHINIKL